MTTPGRRPARWRRLARAASLIAASAMVAGSAVVARGADPTAGASTTTTTSPWVPGVGGTMTLGIDQAPTGCNPDTVAGDTWANRFVLDAVLPSAFLVNPDNQAVYDSSIITQAELQSTTPETIVYTINPKAVWSDGTPITAADFAYTWQQERGVTGPVVSGGLPGATTAPATPGTPTTATPTTPPGATGTTGPAIGYRQVASVTPSNRGRTVTVVFKTPYNDWQSLFNYLLPAHVLSKTGWNPRCSTVSPSIDLSGGPFEIAKAVPGHEVVLVRNPRWWGQVPDLARLVVKIVPNAARLAQWLAQGRIDVALPSGYNQGFLQRVTSAPNLASQSQPSSTFLQLDFSTTATSTASLDVRLALAHMVDRRALIDEVVGWSDSSIVPGASLLFAQTQTGYPAHKPPPPQVSGQPGYTSTTVTPTGPTATPFPPAADQSAANRLLLSLGYIRVPGAGSGAGGPAGSGAGGPAGSGAGGPAAGEWELPSGKPFTVRLAVDGGDPWAASAGAVVARQLQASGVGVTVVTVGSAQAAGMDLSSGSADLALLPMHSSPFPSQAIGWYTPLLGPAGTGGSEDWSNLQDATVTSLLLQASQQLNPVDAAPIYSQADKILWQDMVGLPLFTEPTTLAWSGLTDGVSAASNPAALLWSPETWSMRVPPTSPDTASGG